MHRVDLEAAHCEQLRADRMGAWTLSPWQVFSLVAAAMLTVKMRSISRYLRVW